MDVTDELLIQHQVLVRADNPFQRRARLLQALWREAKDLPLGERRAGIPLGSRLPKEFARTSLANLMSPAAREAALREVAGMRARSGQKIDEDRLWANLLSSQPLAFSLFAVESTSQMGVRSTPSISNSWSLPWRPRSSHPGWRSYGTAIWGGRGSLRGDPSAEVRIIVYLAGPRFLPTGHQGAEPRARSTPGRTPR
jgi:hypothetical protein